MVTSTNAAATAMCATPERSDGHDEKIEASGAIGATAGTAASGTSASRARAVSAPFLCLRRGSALSPGRVRASVSLRRARAGTIPYEGRYDDGWVFGGVGSARRNESRSPAGWADGAPPC